MELHEMIKRFRKERGISQIYIANKLNISTSGYSMKESGKRPINTNELIMICDALGISPAIFFEENIHVKLINENLA